MKKRLLFGVWEPDAVELTGGGQIGLEQIENVIPVSRGYKGILGWYYATIGGASFTGTLAAYTSILGALSTLDESGKTVDFVGTTTNVYAAKESTIGITDVTVSAGNVRPLGAEGFRDFAQYGNYVISAPGANSAAGDPSYYEHGSSTAFSTLTSAFKAKTVAAIRDFVVFGHTYDSTDGERRTRVRWSAFGDPFTYTPSAATQSDFQDLLSDIGTIQRIIGGDIGYIIGTNGTYIMEYVGPPLIFRFTYTHRTVGTQHPLSCVLYNGRVYLYSTAGLVSIGPQKEDVRPIGSGRVDDSFARDVQANGVAFQVRGYKDLFNGGVGFQYSGSSGAGSGAAYFYHEASDRWVLHSNRPGAWFVYGSNLTEAYQGVAGVKIPTAHAFVGNGVLYAQANTSATAQAVIGTGMEELTPGRRSIVERVYPLFETRTLAFTAPVLRITAIPHASLAQDALNTYRSAGTWNTNGYWTGGAAPASEAGFNDGRYHRFQIETNDGEGHDDETFYGLDVIYHPRGEY